MPEDNNNTRAFLTIADAPEAFQPTQIYHCSFCGNNAYDYPEIKYFENPSKTVFCCNNCVRTMVAVAVNAD